VESWNDIRTKIIYSIYIRRNAVVISQKSFYINLKGKQFFESSRWREKYQESKERRKTERQIDRYTNRQRETNRQRDKQRDK
jgi:hypothetical protein